jgi:hypothetical protein
MRVSDIQVCNLGADKITAGKIDARALQAPFDSHVATSVRQILADRRHERERRAALRLLGVVIVLWAGAAVWLIVAVVRFVAKIGGAL